MSVQTEITRLQGAKDAIIAAIEGKNVTVPDGTTLDGLAALVESIEAGGGGGSGLFIATGSYTPSEDQTTTEIDSGLIRSTDVEPTNLILLLAPRTIEVPNGSYIILYGRGAYQSGSYSWGLRPSGESYYKEAGSSMHGKFMDSGYTRPIKISIAGKTTANYTYGLVAGTEYVWAVMNTGGS